MANSYVQYAPGSPTTLFSLTFPYIDKAHVAVRKNGTLLTLTTDYTWSSSTQIQLVSSATSGDIVELRRSTSPTVRLVVYANSAKLTDTVLNTDGLQDFYLAQEAFDIATDALNLTASNLFDARTHRIINVVDPVNDQDAVTKKWLVDNVYAGTGVRVNIGTEWVSTSLTTKTFTVPSGVRRVTVALVGVSVSGASALMVRLGTAAGISSTSYVSVASSGGASGDHPSGFALTHTSTAAYTYSGNFVMTIENPTTYTWTGTGSLATSSGAIDTAAGSKVLSGELTTVTVTTEGGANTFDGGVVNISYEY